MGLGVMGGRGPLKSMGRPDGCTDAGGLGGDLWGFLWGNGHTAVRQHLHRPWGWVAMGEGYGAAVGLRGFYGAGVKRVSRDLLQSMGRPDGCTAAGGLGGDLWG